MKFEIFIISAIAVLGAYSYGYSRGLKRETKHTVIAQVLPPVRAVDSDVGHILETTQEKLEICEHVTFVTPENPICECTVRQE